MSKGVIVFEHNGDYHREGVHSLDLKGKTGGATRQSPTTISNQSKPTVSMMNRTTPKAPGSFNLASLRSSIFKSNDAVVQAPLPKPEDSELSDARPVAAPNKVDVPESVPETPAPQEEVKVEEQPKVEVEVQVEEQPKVEQQIESNSEEDVAEAIESFELNQVEESPTSAESDIESSESPKEVLEEAQPTFEMHSLDSAPVVETQEESIKEEVPKKVAPAMFDLSAIASSGSNQTSSPIESKKMDSVQEEKPQIVDTVIESLDIESPKEKTDVEILESVVDESGIETFNIITLQQLLSVVHADAGSVGVWCLKCVKKIPRHPSTLFSASFKSELRFYNVFTVSAKNSIGVVIGAGDAATCASLDLSTGKLLDKSKSLSAAQGIITVKGYPYPIALFTERLRTPIAL